jgi:uncharacterized damage-inducible protein DinB
MKRAVVVAALTLIAAPLAAQATQNTSRSAASAAVGASRGVWEMMSGYVLRTAEMIPEADYSFRPTEQVRTIGQLVAHVAGAQDMFCAAALGEPAPAEDAIPQNGTKAQLVAALRASTAHCERAYAQVDADAMGTVTLFGQQMSRLQVLNMNAAHDGEHYGNLVTYMRLKGMVPPSSQPQPQQ